LGVFARILTELANPGQDTGMQTMDTTHVKAHRTTSILRGKRRGLNDLSGEPRAG
jgi:hypothetical protein